jgi:hypothetical protein
LIVDNPKTQTAAQKINPKTNELQALKMAEISNDDK